MKRGRLSQNVSTESRASVRPVITQGVRTVGDLCERRNTVLNDKKWREDEPRNRMRRETPRKRVILGNKSLEDWERVSERFGDKGRWALTGAPSRCGAEI